MTLLQHHVLALSLTAITTLGLGLLVFLAEPKRRLNRIFGLYSLAISSWSFTEALVVGANDQTMANFWSYLCWSSVIFIAPTFIHTVFLSTEEGKRKAKILIPAYVASFTFLFLHLFTHLMTEPPKSVGYVQFHNNLTMYGSIIPLTFLILVNIALWKLWCAYGKATAQRKIQLKYLFWSSVVGYLGGSPDWCFPFGFYIPFLSPFGIYGVPMYSIATTYAVLHHRLFNVNLIIRKSLIYSLLVTALTVGYFGLIYGVERLLQITIGYSSPWIGLTAFAIMSLAFQPLKILIQRLVDWLLFRAPHEELVKRVERLEQEALQAEKFRAVSTLAAGMAHEIKNPLTAIKTFSESVPELYNDPDFIKRYAETIPGEIRRIQNLVHDLLFFSRPKPPEFKPIELGPLIHSTVSLLSSELSKHHIHWTVTCQHNGATPQADADQIRQVLINLIQNAAAAMPNGGTLIITTQTNDGHLELKVSDTGQGIPKELLPKIFDPFVTTKQEGNGLGLAMVYSIVQAHRGSIHAESTPGHGTTFTIRLPI